MMGCWRHNRYRCLEITSGARTSATFVTSRILLSMMRGSVQNVGHDGVSKRVFVAFFFFLYIYYDIKFVSLYVNIQGGSNMTGTDCV